MKITSNTTPRATTWGGGSLMILHQSEGFPERDILSLPVIPPWDLPGWESCWDAVAVAVVVAVAVGVTWYQYY